MKVLTDTYVNLDAKDWLHVVEHDDCVALCTQHDANTGQAITVRFSPTPNVIKPLTKLLEALKRKAETGEVDADEEVDASHGTKIDLNTTHADGTLLVTEYDDGVSLHNSKVSIYVPPNTHIESVTFDHHRKR